MTIMATHFMQRRTILCVVIGLCIVTLLTYRMPLRNTYFPQGPSAKSDKPQESFNVIEPTSSLKPFDPICDTVSDRNNTLLVIKTGATEAFEKLPTHLITTLTCVKDFLKIG